MDGNGRHGRSSGQVRSGQVRSGQVRSGQVRSGQVHPSPVRPPGAGPSRRDQEPRPVVALVRVLLLNASHEPLAVVTGRRALVLVVAGKAECVLERTGSPVLRSPSVSVTMPAVVRLRRYVRVPYQAPPAVTRAGVLRRDSRRCAYCHGRGDTIDHVVPKSRGGAHSWENCVACCVRCNARKADRLLDELGWSLTFNPAPPRRGAFGRLWSTEDADPCWEPWLSAAA
jgi:5-methylcytosine-specific restriction endonuclease McrA